MQSKNNLELKHFCPDFRMIREALKELGAKKEGIKLQKDYFFNLPAGSGSPRLKLRLENGTQTLIYYDRPEFKANTSTLSSVKLYEVADQNLLPFLSFSLGVKGVVDKKREIWRKGETVFHLDNVAGVGNIFEIELQKNKGVIAKDKGKFKKYQEKLSPLLGTAVSGSNIDLVLARRKNFAYKD